MQKTISRYGLDWPSSYTDVYIDLVCAKKWREEPYRHGNLLDPWEHLLSACRKLFTNEEFGISPWTEAHAVDWTMEKFCITWGGAACSKSNDYGCFSILDWITDPTKTVTLMASTTREMLKMRSYESVVRYFNILKRNPYFLIPGKESRTSCAILNENDEDTGTTVKASVRGVAVNDGGSIQGAHLPYVRLILDEMALMRQETFDARTNLSLGAEDFRFYGLANPESLFDLSARAAVPIEGWASVDEMTETWRSRYGKVRHHNSEQSPAIIEPDGEKKYPYLARKRQLDDILAEENGNADSPRYWVMVKGFPPPQGVERTILTEADLTTYGPQDTATWMNGENPIRAASLDAAFTHDGDGCVLLIFDVGRVAPGVPAIVAVEKVYLTLEASAKRPVTAQIVDQVRGKLSEHGIPVGRLAVDDSGTQGIADAIDMALGGPVVRYNYATKASDNYTAGGREKYVDRYADKITELWVLFGEFVRARQIRGLDADAARYFTSRRITRRKQTAKNCIESKKEFKKRTGGRSPDEADAWAMAVGLVRDLLGFNPGKAPERFSAPQTFTQVSGKPFGIRTALKSNYARPFKGRI